jgi:hypothetical protein
MDPPVARLSRALNRAFMSSYLLPRSGHACGSSRTVGNAEVGIRQRHTLAEATICNLLFLLDCGVLPAPTNYRTLPPATEPEAKAVAYSLARGTFCQYRW